MTRESDSSRQAANALRHSVLQMARRLRSLRSEHGVSGSKLSILGHLHRLGAPMTARDLARLERLQPQSLTRIIAELDAEGLIERRPDTADRRQIRIAISQRGTDLLVVDAHRHNVWLTDAMQTRLTDAERALLRIAVDLLDRLASDSGTTSR
ncbi:MAG TPA: MarR family transcriptional regulator [Steroidobacteraceae bacterium]|nr:MarR family transcriptional regulator [Steroidobacteraceae bacterium]